MRNYYAQCLLAVACLISSTNTLAQRRDVNYDETKVPNYTLPNVLMCQDGHMVTTAKEWEKIRRPEVMEMLSAQEYGRTPKDQVAMKCDLLEENTQALGGKATMQQLRLRLEGNGKHINTLLLVYFPNNRKGKVPVVIGYNFKGNHSITSDESIFYSPYFATLTNRADPVLERNNQMSRWPIEKIIDRGFALVTMCYQDIFPDNAKGRSESAAILFRDYKEGPLAPDAWQALGIWAWAQLSLMDCINPKTV